LKDPYRLWVEEVSESEVTKARYLYDIVHHFEGWLRENYGWEAREIPAMWRKAKYRSVGARERFLDELRDIMRDFFAHLKARQSPLAVNRLMSTVMSYLHSYEIPIKPLRLKHPYVAYHNRDITKEEIRLILDHSDVRNRATYLMFYESGIRPETLVHLTWRHIKDEFLGHKVPMKINLTSDILKCRVAERWTFIGQDGFEALKRYLATRMPLKEEDYVFVTEKPAGRRLKSSAFSQAFNKLVKRLGLAEPRGPDGRKPKELRLYCLRKAFDKLMKAAVPDSYVEFWMGHTGTATHYVSSDPEHHRQLYAKGYESLRVYKQVDAEVIAKLTQENIELKQRLDRLETALAELADLKAQIKRENKLLGLN